MRDYSEYIGIPFGIGGRTREKLDCYGLIMLLYKELHNVEIPDVISPEFAKDIYDVVLVEKLKWTPCELEEGAAIVFNVRGYGSHVGYYIGNDRIIHTWQATGSVIIERLGIAWKHRIMGIYKWTPDSQLK